MASFLQVNSSLNVIIPPSVRADRNFPANDDDDQFYAASASCFKDNGRTIIPRFSHTHTRKHPRVVKMRATVATSDRKRPMCSPREFFSKDKHPTGPDHLLACLQLCETPATGARGHQIKLKFPRHRKTLLPLSSELKFSNRGKIIHAPARVLGCCQMLAKVNLTKSAKS